MEVNSELMEKAFPVPAFNPVDLSSGANNGAWICMKDYHRLRALLVISTGTSGDDPTITFQQATDINGTGAKSLATVTRFRDLTGTPSTTLNSFTLNTQAAAATVTKAGLGVAQVLAVEVKAEALDVTNGFWYVRANVAQMSAARLGVLLYEAYCARHPQATPTGPIL